MPPKQRIQQDSLEFDGSLAPPQELAPESRPTALVHILTPEFHGFDLAGFTDIPDAVVERASAPDLQPLLFRPYIRKSNRDSQEMLTFSYQTAEGDFVTVALTPEEYNEASESVDKLAQRVHSRVLALRDEKLRKETGNPNERARGEVDIRTAHRGAMRVVMDRQASMESLLETQILPRIELIERFKEMSEGTNSNLARGTRQVVSERFEQLRTTVFDDMLDVIALQKKWSPDMVARAKRVIQKRLYVSGTPGQKVANFREMIGLAQLYYGHKRALILTKIEEARHYRRTNPDVVADIENIDKQRSSEKEETELVLF